MQIKWLLQSPRWNHLFAHVTTFIFREARPSKNVCRQMFSSLLGMSGRGHFTGNMRTYFIWHNSAGKKNPIVLSWQGARWKRAGSYIKFTILTSAPVSSGNCTWNKVGAREWGVKKVTTEEVNRGDFQGQLQLFNGVCRSQRLVSPSKEGGGTKTASPLGREEGHGQGYEQGKTSFKTAAMETLSKYMDCSIFLQSKHFLLHLVWDKLRLGHTENILSLVILLSFLHIVTS